MTFLRIAALTTKKNYVLFKLLSDDNKHTDFLIQSIYSQMSPVVSARKHDGSVVNLKLHTSDRQLSVKILIQTNSKL